MKRKFVVITISYVIGLIWGLYFNKNIALIFCIIFSIIFLVRKRIYIALICLVILFSCIYTESIKHCYDTKYNNIENCDILGTIIEDVSEENYLKKYIIKVISVNGDYSFKNTKVMVYESISKVKKSTTKYGSLAYMTGKFEYAEKNRNYKGYNYNEYLKSKQVYGIVKTDSNNIRICKENNLNIYSNFLYELNNSIKKRINQILPEETSSICIAIILGDKTKVNEEIIDEFSESSLSHILAISGMHMNYIIVMISVLLSKLGNRNKKYFTILIILVFCNLVGNTNSIMRSSIMVTIYLAGSLLYRKSDSLTNLSIAALVILIINPYAIKSTSFILSFIATLGLILFSKPIENKFQNILNQNKIVKYIKQSIIVSVSANILIIPILVIYFNKISLIFLISTLFANVLLSIIMPLAIFSISLSFLSVKISTYLGHLLNFFLNILLYISQISSKIKGLSFIVCTPNKVTVIFYYIVIFVLLIKSKTRKKYIANKIIKALLCVYLSISIIFCIVDFIDTNMYVHFIDVGQGDSTLIITPTNKKILIDGGGSETDDYVGKNILLPYLLNRGIKVIDYIMISHFDTDHVRTD